MPQPKCGFCNNTSFTADKHEVGNLLRAVMFVWCDKCGAVVGVLEMESAARKIDQMTKRVK